MAEEKFSLGDTVFQICWQDQHGEIIVPMFPCHSREAAWSRVGDALALLVEKTDEPIAVGLGSFFVREGVIVEKEKEQENGKAS